MKFAALVAVLAVGLTALAGCSGDDAPAPAPTATASATATALATTTATPTSPPPSRTPTPTSAVGLPDLVPAGAMLFAEPPPEGCTRDPSEIPTPVLIVCVENQGTGPAGPFTVSSTGTSEFGPLAAGERACATTGGASRGIQVEVDVGNRVAESDETNNSTGYFVGVITPPMMCTITPTPTPTGVPLGRCSEAVSCDKTASSTLRSQQSCCDLALDLTGLPFSWCPVTAIDEASGDCSQCVDPPCQGLSTQTPTPTPSPVPT